MEGTFLLDGPSLRPARPHPASGKNLTGLALKNWGSRWVSGYHARSDVLWSGAETAVEGVQAAAGLGENCFLV